jgi:two-component system cell cycle response regulator
MPSTPRTVLVVDDDVALRGLTARWLTNATLRCLEASTGEQAVEVAIANAASLDAIVLDIMMPGIDGFETLRRLKANEATAHIPVVLLTAHATNDKDFIEGADSGAVDHLVKPFKGPVLVAKVRAIVERARNDRDLRVKLRNAEETATIDPLTGLGNRRHFEARFKEEAAHARRHAQPFALVIIDIDHFKSVNDTFGHEEGDRVLVHVADAMRSILRADDAAFRYGGEEFVLILRACEAKNGALAAERLRAALKARPIVLGEGEARVERIVTFSAGVAAASAENGYAVDDLLGRADAALYRAKRGGRDRTETA